MSLTLTTLTQLKSEQVNKNPQLVFKIDGVDTAYGSVTILKVGLYGDPGMDYGDVDLVYGGLIELADQSDLISLDGTTTTIQQQLAPDKGSSSGISSLQIALVDKNLEASELISPGIVTEDVLGRKAAVYLGFKGTAYPRDYVTIFRGVIDEITSKAGTVVLNIASPDQKKRQEIFNKVETKITGTAQDFLESDVSVAADSITVTAHGLDDGDAIKFDSTGTLPAPLKKNQKYFVTGSNTNTIKVALDEGGAAIDLTTDGSLGATHSLIKGSLNSVETTIFVDSTDDFLRPGTGPSGMNDTSLRFYIRIEDELIQYTGISGNSFTGCTRGALNTIAVSHASDEDVSSFYRLIGDPMTLALKIMLSGWNDYYQTGVEVSAFNVIEATNVVPNAIWFQDVDIADVYGITVGDYISTTGATNGANNVTLKTINLITILDNGSYIEIDDVSFVDETNSPATISFRSQYDTLGGEQGKNSPGLKMTPDEVDVAEHQRLFRLFLSGAELDFYLKDTIKGKEFLEGEIYYPISCYSIPRKARSSVGYHIGPIPGANIKTFDIDNILHPSKIQLKRSTNKNFFNTVVYKFDEDQIEDKFTKGVITVNADSKNRIKIGTKALVIESRGLRTTSLGENVATSASNRRLNRYAFGAEYFENIEVFYGDGFNLEIGDILIFDGRQLQITDTTAGTRSPPPKLYEVINKSLDIKTGSIKISITDTSFSTSNRYALIGMSSIIKSAASTSQFTLTKSFASVFGPNEYLKWKRYKNVAVKVHSTDSNWTRNGESVIKAISGNTITLDPPLSFTPQPGDIMELCQYNSATEQIKLIYGHMTDNVAFDDTKAQYKML